MNEEPATNPETEVTEGTEDPAQEMADTAADRLANIDRRLLIIDRNSEETLNALRAQNIDLLLVCVCLACCVALLYMIDRDLRALQPA